MTIDNQQHRAAFGIARKAKLWSFRAARLLGLFAAARWLTGRHLKILCYHGFEMNDEASFRPKLFIRPADFERRLATIARRGMRVLPLDEAIERLYAGTLPRNALVITIDDGFCSVYEKAAPLLERYGFPATVYVTTYYVERPNPVFRLAVQYLFEASPKRLVVLRGVRWSADRTVDLSDAAERHRTAWECIGYGERQCEEERVAICERLGQLLGVPYETIVASRALSLMTPEQLVALERSGVAVELHTHRHVLPAEERSAAMGEIIENSMSLWRLTGRDCRHFCYPSGLFDERQWPWLDELGVKSSTTCLPGLNSASTPRHGLRRFLDGANIEQVEFEAALSGFSDIARAAAGLLRRRR